MSGWKAKRFWKEASVAEEDGGFAILLDGRPVRSPAKTKLVVPSRALAELVAAEWDAQEGEVRPETMPATRAANSALDKVTPQFHEVAEMLAAYGGSDLLCYRATGPEGLVARQVAAWDPLLDWLHDTSGVRLNVGSGIMPVAQDSAALDTLLGMVKDHDAFQLAAFHDLVTISGSLVVALAVAQGRIDAEAAWNLSRIDERWQEEQWGEDEEAQEHAALKREAFLFAARLYAISASAL